MAAPSNVFSFRSFEVSTTSATRAGKLDVRLLGSFAAHKERLNARKSGEWESSQLRLTLAEDAVSPIRQSSLPAKASLEPWRSMKFGRRTREHLSQIPERDNVLHRVRCCLEST